jgi:hypothetical protein
MHVKEKYIIFIKNKNVNDKYNSSPTNHAMHIADAIEQNQQDKIFNISFLSALINDIGLYRLTIRFGQW